MKYLDALLKAGIIVLLYLILTGLQEGFKDVHLVRYELSQLKNRLDPGMKKFEVQPKGKETP